jgi:hypothetical protein
MKNVTTMMVVATATAAVTLVVAWPRATSAREVTILDRQGEWDEDGSKFGDIVVHANLVPDATGWVLVRKLENKGDAREKCTVAERLLRTETMPDARVEPSPTVLFERTQTFELGPHEKRAIGIRLSDEVSAEMTASARQRAKIENARSLAITTGNFEDRNALEATYMRFDVDYLKPLSPGDTAAREENGVDHPARMPL